MTRRAWASVAVLFALACGGLAACARPLPFDKAAYIGEWTSPNMRLLIGRDGMVAYARREGASTTTLNAPLKRFEGANFVVGVLFVSTTFVVTRAPYRNAGRWRMVVDGVVLTRIESEDELEIETDENVPQTSI